MYINKPLLIRDTREKIGHGWDWGEDEIFRGTTLEKLSVGDYSIQGLEHLIFIDRKESVFEIMKNITEKRFHNLIHKAAKYKYKYIIFEFPESELVNFPKETPKAFATDINGVHLWKKMKMSAFTVHKSLNTIQTKYGIKMLYCRNTLEGKIKCHELLTEIYKLECSKK